MADDFAQAYARLTAHEFLLEILYANLLAQMPENEAKDFAAQLRQRMRSAWLAPDANPGENDLEMAKDAAAMMDRFLDKVASRIAEHRAKSIREGLPSPSEAER